MFRVSTLIFSVCSINSAMIIYAKHGVDECSRYSNCCKYRLGAINSID